LIPHLLAAAGLAVQPLFLRLSRLVGQMTGPVALHRGLGLFCFGQTAAGAFGLALVDRHLLPGLLHRGAQDDERGALGLQCGSFLLGRG
jgi:hypothetical protein